MYKLQTFWKSLTQSLNMISLTFSTSTFMAGKYHLMNILEIMIKMELSTSIKSGWELIQKSLTRK